MMMRPSPRFWAQCCGWAVIGFALTACAAYSVAANDPAKGSTAASGYPGPTLDSSTSISPPLPTDADGSPNDLYSYFATPSPDEAVVVAEVAEIVPEAKVPLRYSIESQPLASGPEHWRALYVVDLETKNKVRLGDDSGTAIEGALSDEYFLWFFICDVCQGVKSGFHAYSLVSGKDIWIAEKVYHTQGSVQIAGQWVTYLKPPGEPRRYAAQLYAYNLQTGENLLIAKNAVYSISEAVGHRAVNEDQVAWIADGATVNDWTLHVYDLKGHSTRQISVDLKDAHYLSVSPDAVVWWDVFWKGYDLERGALFTIPVIPVGWENVSVQKAGPVLAKGNQLHWTLQVNGKDHYFTAPIVPKGQGPQATHLIPTPVLKLTVSVPTPTPITLSTAYP